MLRAALLLLAALGLSALAVADLPPLLFSSGPPAERASAPYNHFANCTACHMADLVNAGSGSVLISGPPAEYTPGATYPITVTVAQSGQSRWGYELTVLDDNGDMLGSLTNPDSRTRVFTNAGREFASHKSGGTFQGTPNGPVSWTVDWVAPPSGAGTARFYASGNAANNSGGNSGDLIYNFAAASAEAGTAHPDATVLVQANLPDGSGYSPELSRAVNNDRLQAEIRVSNHLSVTQSYVVATRVRLPGGSYYPASGFISTTSITLAPGATDTIRFDKPIKDAAPLGSYRFQALIGYAPSTLVDSNSFEFIIVP